MSHPPLRGNLTPSRWHRDRSVLIQPYLSMFFIFRNYRELGVIYQRHEFFKKRRWATVEYDTKHRTLDEAIELVLERNDVEVPPATTTTIRSGDSGGVGRERAASV